MADPVRIYIAAHVPSHDSMQAEMVHTLRSMLEHNGYEIVVPDIHPNAGVPELAEVMKGHIANITFVLAFFLDSDHSQVSTSSQAILAKRDYNKPVLVTYRNHTLQTIIGVGNRWKKENPRRFDLMRYENIADISVNLVPLFLKNLDYKDTREMTLREAVTPSEA